MLQKDTGAKPMFAAQKGSGRAYLSGSKMALPRVQAITAYILIPYF